MTSYHNRVHRTVLVFVHLGETIPQELYHHANLATKFHRSQDIYLITDSVVLDFPGQVISLDEYELEQRFRNYQKRFPEISELDNGYWDFTLRRLLVLGVLENILEPETRIIHIESDVMILLPITELVSALERINQAAIPKLGSSGIASILYIPSIDALANFRESILLVLDHSQTPLTDMQVLGMGLSQGWLTEIPSVPTSESSRDGSLIFDGAAIGQYLFGVNPIHTQGLVVSGYNNPHYPLELDSIQWSLDLDSDSTVARVVARNLSVRSDLACLHVHSKELLPLPHPESLRWQRALLEANGGFRKQEIRKLPPINYSRMSFRSKLIKSRRLGLVAVVKVIGRKTGMAIRKSRQ